IYGDTAKIHEIAQNSKENFGKTLDNINATMSSLKILQRNEKDFPNKGYYKSFRNFIQVSDKIRLFVDTVAQRSAFFKYINAYNIKNKYKKLYQELTIETLKDNSQALEDIQIKSKLLGEQQEGFKNQIDIILQEILIIKNQVGINSINQN
ncbi:32576_t:CDS:1, partial [Racocetra persica]